MASLTDQQKHDALSAFMQSPAFLALPEGRDRYNAVADASAALGGDLQNLGSGGLFQSIAGQSDLESALTRAIGIAGGAVVAGGLIAGGGAAAGSGGAAAAGQTPAEWAAGSTTVGGASGGAAAGGAGAGSILQTAQNLAPVLGGAASAAGKANQVENAQQLQDAQFNLDAPATRLRTAMRGALALAGPEKFTFNGPGSGLHGDALTSSGGFETPLPKDVRGLAQTTIDQQIAGAKAPPLTPNAGGTGSDILGGTSLAAALLGAFAKNKNPTPGAA